MLQELSLDRFRNRDAGEVMHELQAKHSNGEFPWEDVVEASYKQVIALSDTAGIAVDIGAHRGRHLDVLASLDRVSGVVGFEPIPFFANYLADRYSAVSNVRIVNACLGNEETTTRFFKNNAAPEESGLRQRSFYNNNQMDLEEIEVTVSRLDSQRFDKPVIFIKIDTEGGEIDILKGAANTLRADRPIASVEFGAGGYDAYGYGPQDLIELLDSYDYALTDPFLNPIDHARFASEFCSRFYWDYFIFPMEKLPHRQV